MKMIKYLPAVVLGLICAFQTSQAQVKVGDNPTTINANSVLEIESTDKGLLLPRIALTSLSSPAPLANHVAGMQVYNITDDDDKKLAPGIYYNNGNEWMRVSDNVTSTIIEGIGEPTIPCTESGVMYTDIDETSSTFGEVWTCSGGNWVPAEPGDYTTPFYIGTQKHVDPKGDKHVYIRRPGSIYVGNGGLTGAIAMGTASVNGIELWTGAGGDARVSVQRDGINPNLILTKKGNGNGFRFIDFRINGSSIGNISNAAGTLSLSNTSDYRLKTNIIPTKYSLQDLLKIEVKEYSYIADQDNTKSIGFIAQDLHKVYPEAVSVGGDDVAENPWTVDYAKLTPLLVKAIQDQQNEIEELKETINTRLAQLEKNDAKNKVRVAKRSAKKKRVLNPVVAVK